MNRESTEGGLIALTPRAILRRNSTGKMVSSIPNLPSGGREKPIPNYLRASTSSCHDFCKYGMKHSFDEKARRPTLLRKPDNNAAKSKEDAAKGLNACRVRKSVVRPRGLSTLKPTSDEKIKTEVWDAQASALVTKDPNKTKDIKRNIPDTDTESSEESIQISNASPIEDTDSVGDDVSATESPPPIIHDVHVVEKDSCSVDAEVTQTLRQVQELQSPINKGDPASQLKVIKPETLVLKVSRSPVSSRTVKKDPPMRKALESVKPKVKREISSPAPATPKLRISKQTIPLVRRSDSSAKPATSLRPAVKTVKQTTPVVKLKSPLKATGRLYMTPTVKSKSPNLPRGLSTTPLAKSQSPLNPSRGLYSMNNEKKGSKSLGSSKTEGKKILVPSRVTSSSKLSAHQGPRSKLNKLGSIKLSGSLKNLKKVGVGTSDEKVREKTIYVVEPKMSNVSSGRSARSNVSRRSPSLSMSSLSSFLSRGGNELVEGSDHAFNEDRRGYDKAKILKSEVLRRVGSMRRQEKDSTPYKLKFRRGKVVNIQSDNYTGPTRLRFRPRRVIGSSPSGKGDGQKSYRRNAEAVSEDGRCLNPEAGNVVLRHQDVEEPKKDTQGLLLNHVIEETASKLVETRKSKVKALVGAFETVISLQESKPF